jgi:transposase InsO family protein
VRKVWRQLKRGGHDVARCTVARVMQTLGLQGVIRGKPVRTTISDKATPCPLDVNRSRPRTRMRCGSLTSPVWRPWAGFVYVAFVIDAYARRIVGWRVSRTAHASFVLDTLEETLHDRRVSKSAFTRAQSRIDGTQASRSTPRRARYAFRMRGIGRDHRSSHVLT